MRNIMKSSQTGNGSLDRDKLNASESSDKKLIGHQCTIGQRARFYSQLSAESGFLHLKNQI